MAVSPSTIIAKGIGEMQLEFTVSFCDYMKVCQLHCFADASIKTVRLSIQLSSQRCFYDSNFPVVKP